jgi:ATP-dependent DNA helicase RecG
MAIEYDKRKKYSPEELMEMAFQESLFSIHEHIDKPDPKVGAIITTSDGKILATAHRGELRIGEHCKYTLIERKLKSANLKGCHLYVTLEPCVDEARKQPKRGCSTHIIKARIGKVFIGIRDPNVDVENKGAEKLMSKRIEVEDFHPEVADKIRESMADFIQYQEAEKLKIKQQKKEEPLEYTKQTVPNTTISLFSEQAVDEFIENSEAIFTYPSQEFNDWALSFGLATKDGNNVNVPTNLGLLLFGEHSEEKLHHTIFKVELDYGNGKTEIKDFGGPVATQLQRVMDFIQDKGLRMTIDRSNAKRETISEFPTEILREVIANAIIHRDYSIEQATNYLYISSEKIIVRSPGLPMPPLTIDDLRTMDLPSISRNPKIMFVYNRMGLAEQRGIGLRNLKKLPEYGFPLPVFNMRGSILEIVIARDSSLIPELIGVDAENLTQEDRNGLFFIQKNESVAVKDYATHFGLTDKTAQRRIAKLLKLRLIEKEGENRWVKYKIKK